MGCSFDKHPQAEPNSQDNDNVITLPVEDKGVNDASKEDESIEQNQEDEESNEEVKTSVPPHVPVTSTPQPMANIPPVTTLPQQQPTPTPYIEQSTPTPVVTEEPPVVDVIPPVDDSSNDMGEF